ncbi:MAG TPA: carbohydrate kinase family protein [Terriglobales bacterium]|nr:carbohydrate kinase family protein [Terriglobales bacterium]
MPRFDVTIAGELNLDLILYGLPKELPEERELLAQRMTLTLGSSSAIVAHNLAALGSRVGFVSRIGDDPLGQIAVGRLAASGVDVSRIHGVEGETKTGLTVILQRERMRNILTYPGTIFDLTLADLDFDYLTDASHFHLSSFYLQRGLTPHVGELFRRLKASGLTISLDTNDDPDDTWGGGLIDVLQYVDVFLPNARELKRIAGTDDLESAVARIAKRVPLLVVKRGEEGALARRGREQIVMPAVGVKLVDPVGAGDSFDAGFLSQFVRGSDLRACLGWANLAGALSTTQPGGTEAFRNREAVEAFFREHAQESRSGLAKTC